MTGCRHELGCIGDDFSRNCSAILEKSAADEQSKQLVEEICAANTSALNELAKSISDALHRGSKIIRFAKAISLR